MPEKYQIERQADSVRQREADSVRERGRQCSRERQGEGERERRETENVVERENEEERETGNLGVNNNFQLIFLPYNKYVFDKFMDIFQIKKNGQQSAE